MKKIIFDIDNATNTLDREMVNHKWIMTPRGLECMDCQGLSAAADNVEDDPSFNLTIEKDNGRKHKRIKTYSTTKEQDNGKE